MSTWYVDNAASGENDGTSWTDAWESFADIVWGGAGVVAGDTVYICGGAESKTYQETLNVGADGSAGNVITIRLGADATHNGKVIIDCENSRQSAIDLQEHDYITIDGIKGDAVSEDYTYGMEFINRGGTTGGYIYALGSPGFNHIIITHIDFDGTGADAGGGDDSAAIRLGSSSGPATDIEVSYCWIHGTVDSEWEASAIIIYGNVDSYTSRLVHHNRIENIYHDGIKTSGGVSAYNNYLANIQGSGHADSIMISSHGYVKIYNNFFDDCDDQNIFLDKIDSGTMSHFFIYNNVFDNDGGFGIVLKTENGDSYIDDIHIYNNTFVNTAGPSIRDSQGRLSNLYIKNNIFSPNGSGSYWVIQLQDANPFADANAFDYNLYDPDCAKGPDIINWDDTAYTLAELQGLGTAREAHGLSDDPIFTDSGSDDFTLTPGSPGVESGVSLSVYFTTDKNGISRPQDAAWDIGAYEFEVAPPETGGEGPFAYDLVMILS